MEGGEEVSPFLFLSPPHMTHGPLKSNSTMCCRGRGREGKAGAGGSSPPLRAFGLAASPSSSRLRFCFPPSWSTVGGEKLETLSSPTHHPPSDSQRPAGAQASSSSGSAWCTDPGFLQTCCCLLEFFLFPVIVWIAVQLWWDQLGPVGSSWVQLGPVGCRLGSDGWFSSSV